MRYLDSILSGLFSANALVSEDQREAILERIRSDPDTRTREGLRIELVQLFENPHTDWVNLLVNDYEVYLARDQDDGRDYVTSRIWNPLFPDSLPPMPK
jgi:hypothetical protein